MLLTLRPAQRSRRDAVDARVRTGPHEFDAPGLTGKHDIAVMRQYYTYLLASESRRLYTGMTDDLQMHVLVE